MDFITVARTIGIVELACAPSASTFTKEILHYAITEGFFPNSNETTLLTFDSDVANENLKILRSHSNKSFFDLGLNTMSSMDIGQETKQKIILAKFCLSFSIGRIRFA